MKDDKKVKTKNLPIFLLKQKIVIIKKKRSGWRLAEDC